MDFRDFILFSSPSLVLLTIFLIGSGTYGSIHSSSLLNVFETYDATLLTAVTKVEVSLAEPATSVGAGTGLLGLGAKTGDEADDGIGSSRIDLVNSTSATGLGAGSGLSTGLAKPATGLGAGTGLTTTGCRALVRSAFRIF